MKVLGFIALFIAGGALLLVVAAYVIAAISYLDERRKAGM